jgi:hypothetical protein
MKTKLFVLLCVAVPLAAAAQINYNGGTYTQDFNTLESGVIYKYYTTMPVGWVISEKWGYVWTTMTNGYSNNYGTYCFSSSANDPDKSIGLVIGSTGQAYLGARFHNATGVTLTSFSLGYYAEQWAKGAVISSDQTIPFTYSLDATNLTSGTFVSVIALDMHSINDGDGVFAALNGNAVSNRQFIAATVSGISWLPNQDLWIRWSGVSHPFSQSHAMAVDDLFFSAVPELQITMTSPARFQVLWSTNYPGYTLQSAATPTPGSWDTVTNVPVIVGGEFGVEIDTTEALRFFRLKMQ